MWYEGCCYICVINMCRTARLLLLLTLVYVMRVCASVQSEQSYYATRHPDELAHTGDLHAGVRTDQRLSMTVDFDMADGEEGVLLMASRPSEAFVLYVESGKAILRYRYVLDSSDLVISSGPLPLGHVRLRFEFSPKPSSYEGRPGRVDLFVNDSEVTPNAGTVKAEGGAEHDDAILDRTFTGKITSVVAQRY